MSSGLTKTAILLKVRNAFFTGLILLTPLAVTWLAFSWLFDKVGGRFRPLFFKTIVPDQLLSDGNLIIVWNILATFIVIILITLLGLVSRIFLGRFLMNSFERFITRIPGVSAVYNTVKQIVSTFSTQNRNLFSKTVLVTFPTPGCYAVGFLTNKEQAEPQLKILQHPLYKPEDTSNTDEEIWCVFVPTTPNPTSGFLLLLPKSKIVVLDMSVADGMKYLISGGTVLPPPLGINTTD